MLSPPIRLASAEASRSSQSGRPPALRQAARGRAVIIPGLVNQVIRAAGSLEPSHVLQWATVGLLLKFSVGDHLRLGVRASRQRDHSPDVAPASLRLLHCCGQFATNQGGTERQARGVCGALAARGHVVSVVTRKPAGPTAPVPGVRIEAAIRAVEHGRLFGITYLGSATLSLLRGAGEADVLHAHHLYFDAVAAVPAGRIRRRPVLAKMVGAGPGGDLDRLRQTAGGSLLLKLLRTLDAVIVPSPTCRTELLAAGFPPERIRIIANGVDTALFHAEPEGKSSTLLPTHGGPVVAFTGRLIQAKGLLDLLEAWALLLRDVPEAHLVLVGSGPIEGEVRRRAGSPPLAGRVHLTGEVPDVRPYLRAVTAFVFPSWAEGLPNALLEAMAMGLPCVATDIGPIRDAVIDGEEALLVPVRTPDRLAAALVTVLTQPVLTARLGRAARKRVEAEFSLEIVVVRLESLYRELCARGHREGQGG